MLANFLSLKKTITLVFTVLIFSSCDKEIPFSGLKDEFKLVSSKYGATYKITVALPENYNSSTDKYETIYVLDGKDDFDFVANKCNEISKQKGTENVLVIGIGYGRDRSIDYTPTKMSSITGGAPEFLNFIEGQLIPHIEKNYRADTSRKSRVIMGHSYGGLFGVYSFSVRNNIFGNYILLSPSLWFDNFVSFKIEETNRDKNKSNEQLVFMGIGNDETEDRMKVPFERFHGTLRDNYRNIKLVKNFESNTTHMSSKNPNIIKGLQYYFENR